MNGEEARKALRLIRDEARGIEALLDKQVLVAVINFDDPAMTRDLMTVYRAMHRIHQRAVQLRVKMGATLPTGEQKP